MTRRFSDLTGTLQKRFDIGGVSLQTSLELGFGGRPVRTIYLEEIPTLGNGQPLEGAMAAAGSSVYAARADHVHPRPPVATQSAAGLMSAADKTKLDGIPAGGGGGGTTAVVTTMANGLMLAADKARLDALQPAAAVPAQPAGAGAAGSSVKYAREDHAHPAIPAATPSAAGLMSAADKTKLDGLTAGSGSSGAAAGDYIPFYFEANAVSANQTFFRCVARRDCKFKASLAGSSFIWMNGPAGRTFWELSVNVRNPKTGAVTAAATVNIYQASSGTPFMAYGAMPAIPAGSIIELQAIQSNSAWSYLTGGLFLE
ncbi:hypothetical protein LH462_06810 [Laribacter hongkongensis]|uniref:Uncharacterized protein n=1 Tax=Laribacter hongkongensis TaxID=168471 RepID=A0ABD4SNU8_9NEIS|nr:hypothetical protein [Laribacter hongkongensis]MCG9025179.1 hypothetical protein [Laribacter hongkongensis]MCG9099767.1 hypothetical protein [Laribacter hongkongensis]MCG9103431.1 hypothetical protein [Laribacter hongkongensis]MCG9111245.1 hypothetical protein [Laribacter hongkongensis]MCG9118599.1 hypothetical protein [Laribacter hongkongensis]